jgi:hypothetical protein
MKFQYIPHAEEKIAERKLPKALIEDTIKMPEKVIPSVFGRQIAQRKVAGKLLRVVYEEKEGTYIIITAYYTELGRYG